MNDLLLFYTYATYMYWPAALVGKVALLSALVLVANGNQSPGQRLLTGVLAAHLFMSAFILYWGLISVGLPFGSRVIRTPVGGPVAFLALAAGSAVAFALFTPNPGWRTRSEESLWANWAFWVAVAVALLYPFHNDTLPGGVFKSPLAVLPHQTLLIGCALVWMTGPQAHRVAAFAFVGGATLLGFYDAVVWGIASSWLLIVYAVAAAVPLLMPGFSITLPTSGGDGTPRERAVKEPRAPRVSRKEPAAPKWKLK